MNKTALRFAQHSARRGAILFTVTIVILLISLAAYGFSIRMQAEYRATVARGDLLQVASVRESGIAYATSFAGMSRQQQDLFGGADNNLRFKAQAVDVIEGSTRLGCFSIVAPQFSLPNSTLPDSNSNLDGANSFRFGLERDASKLSLAAVLQWDQLQPGAGRTSLMQLPGMTESLADAILDWIDEDDETREFGAEADYYAQLQPPRKVPNRIPTSLDELLLVRDVSAALLFGQDKDFNYQSDTVAAANLLDSATAAPLDGTETPASVSTVPVIPTFNQPTQGATEAGSTADNTGILQPWDRLLVPTSKERNVDYYGRRRIHLNDKDLSQLHSVLQDSFDEQIANFVIALRQYGPVESNSPPPASNDNATGSNQVTNVTSTTDLSSTAPPETPGGQANSASTDDTSNLSSQFPTPRLSEPPQYEIESIEVLLTAVVKIPRANSQGDGQQNPQYDSFVSPFKSAANDPERTIRFFDASTLTGRPVIQGRINVHSANREVLLTVPGLRSETVDQILQQRANISPEDALHYVHPVWLYTQEILSVEELSALNWFTSGGDTYRAQIIGFYDGRSPWSRCIVGVDGTVQPPETVYYRDLTKLGRGFLYSELAYTAGDLVNSPTSASGTSPTSLSPAF
ncbi:MAG: general secretion pathway protein GspK [Planctomycetales bacterium]|nr:general secretion pathway protein GspK [Planctomycetales bacterium]